MSMNIFSLLSHGAIGSTLEIGQRWVVDNTNGVGNPFKQDYPYDIVLELKDGWVRYKHHGSSYELERFDKINDFRFIRTLVKD
jgi:hypothetical protein